MPAKSENTLSKKEVKALQTIMIISIATALLGIVGSEIGKNIHEPTLLLPALEMTIIALAAMIPTAIYLNKNEDRVIHELVNSLRAQLTDTEIHAISDLCQDCIELEEHSSPALNIKAEEFFKTLGMFVYVYVRDTKFQPPETFSDRSDVLVYFCLRWCEANIGKDDVDMRKIFDLLTKCSRDNAIDIRTLLYEVEDGLLIES